MKRYLYLFLGTILLFTGLFLGANLLQSKYVAENSLTRNIIMNRIANKIQENYLKEIENIESTENEETPISKQDSQTIDVEAIIHTVYADNINQWKQEYDENDLPLAVMYVPNLAEKKNVNNLIKIENNQSIWVLYEEDTVIGFLLFTYQDYKQYPMITVMNVCIAISFIFTMGILFFINFKILKPFTKFSGYPERLSKGDFTEKLPEMKSRYFGKFIWGVNMLRDKMSYDKKRINRLMKDKQTMITTIAHGIKTPIANIKLYSDAIESGLYQPEGKPNESDAQVAGRIRNNADEITALVQEMIQVSSKGLVDFEPNRQSFYAKELQEYIVQEYTNRFLVLDIPVKYDCRDQSMIQSDKSGITRILSQLLENAIKYGDGTGIEICMEKQEEGHYLYVRNKGELVPENEIPYLFNSFWRGSNAKSVEGSGIGLYEAKQIAVRLSGDLFVKQVDEKNEMEFLLYIP